MAKYHKASVYAVCKAFIEQLFSTLIYGLAKLHKQTTNKRHRENDISVSGARGSDRDYHTALFSPLSIRKIKKAL